MKRLALTLALMVAGLTCNAQAQDAKVSKEREALRRAQAALRAAQEQQSTLQAEKAKAEADTAIAQKDAAAARAQIAGNAARLRSRDAEVSALQAQLQAAQRAQSESQASATVREQNLAQQLQVARQEGVHRQQANQALAQLLARKSQALADAEARNVKLYAFGQELMRRYTHRSPVDFLIAEEPVAGLGSVRRQDELEQWRQTLDALRAAPGGAGADERTKP